MNLCPLTAAILAGSLCLASAGCINAPGKPKLEAEAARPEQVLDFPTLYKQNCAACHGEKGKNGAAISLANPVYLMTAGVDNLQRVITAGLPGTLMPSFGKKAGGLLTDTQVTVLARGMIDAWGRSPTMASVTTLPYSSQTKGTSAQGEIAFATFCAACHGANGAGSTTKTGQRGSIVDPAYLSLISDQGLRSAILAGNPDQGMPDWRSDLTGPGARAMTDQEVTDTVAWMVSNRTAAPGQPYSTHP